MRDVGVGEKGDVGDGVIGNEEIVFRQMSFHHFERGAADFATEIRAVRNHLGKFAGFARSAGA